MRKEFVVKRKGHPLECNPTLERYFSLYYQEPEQGVNDDTGIFLILHGYGTNAETAYYKKLRNEWSTKYNVITLGVDYLGTYPEKGQTIFPKDAQQKLVALLPSEIRQSFAGRSNIAFGELKPYFDNRDLAGVINLPTVCSKPKEEIVEYNDFGYIQTLDCLYAVKYVIDSYEKKGKSLNKKRIFTYGTSFGGYLAQMCGKFAPHTFSLIADNSGFAFAPKSEVVPSDKAYKRTVYSNGFIVGVQFTGYYETDPESPYYFSDDMFQIRSLVDETHCKLFQKEFSGKIMMFHAKKDTIVPYENKYAVQKLYEAKGVNSQFFTFQEKDIDGEVILSDAHTMNADVKKLFEKYCGQYADENAQDWIQKENSTDFDLKTVLRYPCKHSNYIVDYTANYPVINH